MMGPHRKRLDINMGAIPVAGIGGVGMLGLVVVLAVAFPEAGWILFLGSIGGTLLAAALILRRRFGRSTGPGGDSPQVLFREETPKPVTAHRETRRPPIDEQLAAAR